MSELRLALRRLRRTPGFTLMGVLTVALVIGANGLIFSAVRGLLTRPLPFRDGDRIAWIHGRDAGDGAIPDKLSDTEANSLARLASTYEAVAVIGDRSFIRVTGERRTRWNGLWVTPSLFTVLDVRPALGRAIVLDDTRDGGRVAMLGYDRWAQDFGGDSAVIGRPLEFHDGHRFTIVGVLPRGLEFPFGRLPQSGNGSGFMLGAQDFWILGQANDELPGGATIARLRPGTSLETAQAEAATIAARLAADAPGTSTRTLELVPLRDQALGLVGPGLRLAQGFAILMLVLACANLVNLVLLRTSSRDRELAVLAALGATSREIARGVILEIALLAAAGAALGLWLATLARPALRLLAAGSVPMLERVSVDWTVVAFTVLAAGIVAIVVAVGPATAVARGNLHATLLTGGRSHTTDRQRARLRAGLVVSQVALALVLSGGAALITRSFARLMSVDAGFDASGVVSVDVALYDHPQTAEFYRQLDTRLRRLPGVEAVGLVQSTPLTGKWTFTDAFVIVGRTEDPASAPQVSGGFVAFDYFRAMRIPLVAGRHFTEAEYMAGDARVLVINESAARRFFPGASPIGESVIIAGAPRRIIGVVGDIRDVRLDAAPEPQWYQALFGSSTQLIIRTSGKASNAIPMLRRELASDTRLVVDRIEALDAIVDATVAERRMAMRLLGTLAAIALALASIGLYGVVSYDVTLREREFGVRSALGARRHLLLAMVLRKSVGMATVGIGIGIGLSIALTGVLRGLLFEISPTEPVTIGFIAGLLVVVAVSATLRPAWRAASADPAAALRGE